jgi:hypothetical protein
MVAGLRWIPKELPFAAGLNQKYDDRARPMPYLDICKDVQFDELGGVQTRLPYGAAAGEIFGGGTITNARRVVPNGTETALFTNDSLYSWNAQLSKWLLRGTHLAVKVDETPRFVTPGDQINPDRAELSGVVVYAWVENNQVYASAIDKTTGSVLVSQTAVSTAIARPKLVALDTKILLFAQATSTSLTVRAIDPAAPATGIAGAGTSVMAANFGAFYDVVKAGTQDLAVGIAVRSVTTSYEVFKVTPALAVTAATKARTADGSVAVATIADGTQTQIVRSNTTNVQGDLLTTSTLADVHTGQAIGTVTGTPINQVTAEFAGTTAHVFWSFLETSAAGSTTFGTKKNTVTTANSVGTQSTMVLRLGVASRAFLRSGRVFVWLVFASDSTSFGSGSPLGIRAQLQNTYFLYRDDGLLVTKAAFQIAGGFGPSFGRLPTVTGSGETFSWAGTWRRKIITAADHTNYAARSLMDISFTFDSNEARRCVRLGRTLYITGGIPMQYDGVQLAEIGFLVYPWAFAVQDSGVAGNIAAGTYSWKSTLQWQNATGERERSTTATGERLTLAASRFVIITIFNLFVTLKTNTRPPSVEIWRNEAGAQPEGDYYLITGQDPNTTTGDNCYLPNDTTTAGPVFNDNLSDGNLVKREANPENGDVLESLTPPGAAIVIASETRLFLADVAGDEDAVWYSRERDEGEVASFHDGLRFTVPGPGGRIKSIIFLGQMLVVFRESATYGFVGPGLSNLNTGQQFQLVREISHDIGAVSHESVALTPLGVLFKSSKGWQLLPDGGLVRYIGGPVSDYDSEAILSIDVVETQHQVRILSASRMLIWDYRGAVDANAPGELGQWGEWTITDGVHSCMVGGAHVYLAATGTRTQLTTYTGVTYGMDVEMLIKPGDQQQGAVAARALQLLGEYRSSFLGRVRVAYNYSPTYTDDKAWTPSPTTVGGPLQLRHSPRQPRCQALKVRFTAVTDAVRATRATATLAVPVQTSGTNWTATWTATATHPGEMGNTLAIHLAFVVGTGAIDVRDHFAYDPSTGLWSAAVGTIGVLVTGTPTVAQLEAAIAAGTLLATLTSADGTPGKVVNIAAMAALSPATGAFTGGAYGSPTGEALKLTSLGVGFGVDGALFNRIPSGQRT